VSLDSAAVSKAYLISLYILPLSKSAWVNNIYEAEVEFFIEVRTRECALYRSLCTSEYPSGRGEVACYTVNTKIYSIPVDGKIVHNTNITTLLMLYLNI
jgi:hypothetical protein